MLALTTPSPRQAPGWTELAELPDFRGEVASTVVERDGTQRLVVAGGLEGLTGRTSSSVHELDTEAGVWQRLPDLPAPRHHPAAAAIDGDVYVAVGAPSVTDWTPRDTLWVLRDGAGTWETLAPMPEGRDSHRMRVLDGQLHVVGGHGATSDVLGYDPHITVEAAWSLPSQVKRAASIEELVRASHFVSLHVPLGEKTRHLVNARMLENFRSGAVLLNFSREGVVEDAAVLKALESGRLRWYVTDFPSAALIGQPRVIALPHLGASTGEAEDNSAVMVVDQLREYLEHGNLQNAVNFPDASMAREAPYRLAIANANVPDMLGQISHALGRRKLNIHNMLNKSKADMAYTLVDVDSPVPAEALKELSGMTGVLAVRYLPVSG